MYIPSLEDLHPVRVLLNTYLKYKNFQFSRHGIREHFYHDDEFDIHYYKGGKGPVLLFIHGFALDAMLNWADLMIPLSKHFTVIAPDLLWFGQSQSTLDPVLSTQTLGIERLLKNEGIQEYSVIGQSYGGFVAVDLMLKHGHQITRACIANSPGPEFREEQLTPLLNKHRLEHVSDFFVMEDHKHLQRLVSMASYKKPEFPEMILKELHRVYFSGHLDQWDNLLRTLPNERERIPSLEELMKIKTLVLWGDHDVLFPYEEGKKFAKNINAEFVSIANAGHAPQLDDLNAFKKVVEEFFRGK
jgi:pimeloyl-ACP methyl ester carboxylesterase